MTIWQLIEKKSTKNYKVINYGNDLELWLNYYDGIMIKGLNQGQGWSSKVCITVGKNIYDKVKINYETTLDVVQKKWIIATKKKCCVKWMAWHLCPPESFQKHLFI